VELILASASPRRAALLKAAGIPFTVDAAEVDESPRPDEPPEDYVLRLAVEKAVQASRRNPGSLVLGADTTVVINGALLGKPDDERHATEMLELLSGATHDVLTGVALVRGALQAQEIARTRVHFLPLDVSEVAWYVATGEPIGKAGGYAIQGYASRFVDWIEGSYSNVVGLPVSVAYQLLRRFEWPADAPNGRGE
jgi:septum formation protein